MLCISFLQLSLAAKGLDTSVIYKSKRAPICGGNKDVKCIKTQKTFFFITLPWQLT